MRGRQLPLFPTLEELRVKPATYGRSSTFVDNMNSPIHRWFRYSAGFSAQWAEQEIRAALQRGPVRLLDPFAGAGTTLIEGEHCGAPSLGIEAHPFVCRIARAKLAWREPVEQFLDLAHRVREVAKQGKGGTDGYPTLIQKCYPAPILAELDALRRAWEGLSDQSPASELVWLAITAILRTCSPVGTAPWQYVLPKKEKVGALAPFVAYEIQVHNMATDMHVCQQQFAGDTARIYQEDARACHSIPDGWATLVLTSPPYTNNYDYADATRLEMSFWGEVQSWGDLHQKVRRHLVRSCTQHVAADREDLDRLLADPDLDPVREEIGLACRQLAQERVHHGGRKPYHLMVAAYFSDLAKVWKALRRVTSSGSQVCFVVGDSAPYGIHVPVDRWLGELALAAGFHSYRFEKTRDRNVKWRNRKHRVPLHEGRLWVEG
ncbi:MAG: DNA modification methylase [Anaerolineae bacterium]